MDCCLIMMRYWLLLPPPISSTFWPWNFMQAICIFYAGFWFNLILLLLLFGDKCGSLGRRIFCGVTVLNAHQNRFVVQGRSCRRQEWDFHWIISSVDKKQVGEILIGCLDWEGGIGSRVKYSKFGPKLVFFFFPDNFTLLLFTLCPSPLNPNGLGSRVEHSKFDPELTFFKQLYLTPFHSLSFPPQSKRVL